jgi:hypothetical protein
MVRPVLSTGRSTSRHTPLTRRDVSSSRALSHTDHVRRRNASSSYRLSLGPTVDGHMSDGTPPYLHEYLQAVCPQGSATYHQTHVSRSSGGPWVSLVAIRHLSLAVYFGWSREIISHMTSNEKSRQNQNSSRKRS